MPIVFPLNKDAFQKACLPFSGCSSCLCMIDAAWQLLLDISVLLLRRICSAVGNTWQHVRLSTERIMHRFFLSLFNVLHAFANQNEASWQLVAIDEVNTWRGVEGIGGVGDNKKLGVVGGRWDSGALLALFFFLFLFLRIYKTKHQLYISQ